jgi:hypothetical protein
VQNGCRLFEALINNLLLKAIYNETEMEYPYDLKSGKT